MAKTANRFLSGLLAFLMIFQLCGFSSVTAYAEEETETEAGQVVEILPAEEEAAAEEPAPDLPGELTPGDDRIDLGDPGEVGETQAIKIAASIDGYPFATLEEAVAAIGTEDVDEDTNETFVYGSTVELTQAYTLSEPLVLSGGKTVILDLNGKTLTGNIDAYDVDLTLQDGTVNGTVYVNGLPAGQSGSLTLSADAEINADYALILYQAADNTGNGYTVDLNGTVNGIVWVMGNITEGDSVINVNNGAKITGDDVGIALNGVATVNVYDGATVTGHSEEGTGTGIEVRAGQLNVTGGTIKGDATVATTVAPNGSGTTTSGAGIAVAQHTTEKNVTVNISGGDISGYTALSIANPQNNTEGEVKLDVSGGTFTGTVAVADDDTRVVGFISNGSFSGTGLTDAVCVDGRMPQDNGNGKFSIVDDSRVARIGTVRYATLQDAIDAAQAGDTITLLKDVDMTGDTYTSNRIPISKSVTIDGAGHTITVANRGFGVGMNAQEKIDVTFKDVTIENAASDARCIDTRGNLNSLTLDGVTLKTDGGSGYTQPLTIGGNQADAATINISNSTIQTNDAGTAYYAIITFNPVNMSIDNSTIKGWACIYAKEASSSAGSVGSTFEITNSTLISKNVYSGTSNAFSAVMIEDKNVSVAITDTEIDITATGDQKQGLVSFYTSTDGRVVALGEGNNVTFTGENAVLAVNTGNDFDGYGGMIEVSGGIYNKPVGEQYCAPGYIPVELGGGSYSVKLGTYVARVRQLDDSDPEHITVTDLGGYEDLDEAIQDASKSTDTFVLLLADGEYTFANAGESVRICADEYTFTAKAADGLEVRASEPDANGIVTYTVFQPVAQIGEIKYESVDAALAAAQSGDVVEVYAGEHEITSTVVIPANVTLRGAGKDETTLKIVTENGDGLKLTNPNVTICDMTVDGSAITSGGYKSLINVEADGCVLDTVVLTGGGKSTWNSSIMVERLTADQTFTLKNATVSGSFRGVLRESCSGNIVIENSEIDAVYPFNIDGGNGGTVTVSDSKLHGWTSYSGVEKVTFTNCEFSKGNSGYDCVAAYVETHFDNCTFDTDFAIYAQTSPFNFYLENCDKNGTDLLFTNFKEQFPADPDVWTKCNTYVNGHLVGAVAMIGTEENFVEYKSLQAALDAAHEMTGNVTVTLIDDITEVAVIHQKAGLNLTVDGGDHTITGQIHIDGDGRSTGTESLTIQNANFAYDAATYEGGFINLPDTRNADKVYTTGKYNYAHNITVSDCSFAGEYGNTTAFNFGSIGGGFKNIKLVDLTADQMHSLAQMTGVDNVTIEGCTLTNAKNGISLTSATGTVTVSGNDISANENTDGYTFRMKGTSSASATLSGNVFRGFEGLILDSASGKILVTDGFYTGALTAKNGTLKITGGYYSEDPTAYVDLNKYAVVKETIDGVEWFTLGDAVATVTSGSAVTSYTSLEAAFAAAQDGDTITLLKDSSGNGIVAPQGKFATNGLTVDFAGHTYTVDGSTVGSTGTETNGFQLLKDNKITFKNGTIYSEKAKILIQNYSDLTLDGMALTLNNASYSSAYTLSNNNGNVTIKDSNIKANPAGGFAFDVCRYASYPSVNVTVTGNSVINGDIEVSASGSDAKDGFSLMLESGTFTGKIVLDPSAEAAMEATPDKATVKKTTEGVTIGIPEDYKWVDNGDSTSTLTPKTYVAKIGETKYETVAEAVAAAETNDTVEIFVAGTYTLPNLPKNITVEGTVDGVVFKHTGTGNIASIPNGATFRNVTFELGNNNYHGFQHNGGLTFEGCTFNGKFFTYGDETYTNCAFKQTSSDYNMWVYGGSDPDGYTVTYDSCSFVNEKTGKFLNVYNEGGALVNLIVKDCTFKNEGSSSKAALNIKETCGTKALNFNVTISGCTLEGPFPGNSITDTLVVGADGLWQVDDRLDNINDSGITVTLEGEVVYPFFVAQIGDVKYETLAKAVAAVPADGTETLITMIDNEMINVVGSGVTIPAGKNVVLDLNGFQVVGTAAEGKTSALITNKGTLTIQDSSADGTGKLISGATETWIYNGDGNYAGSYASNTITNSGTLTVESGYIENLSTGSATYAIDNNSSGADAIVTINGGTVKGHSVAIRQFANSTAKENSVTVNGGLVEAGYSGIWIQLPSSDATKAMKATLNVTGGELKGGSYAFYDYSYGNSFDATQYNLSGGTLNGMIFSFGANIAISGGTYNGEVAIKQAKPSTVSVTGGYFGDDVYTYGENASKGFITGGYFASLTYENDGKTYDCNWISLLHPDYKYVDNTDEDSKDAYPYKVVPKEYVAENTNTGVKYETLEEAIAAAKDGETIKLLKSCSGNGIKAPQGKFAEGLTVDFAGFTYTVDGSTVGSTGTETNGFQLLKDNKITFKGGTISSEKAKILIQNYSDLTLDGMTLTLNNANYTSAYTLSNNNGNVVIKNSTITANPAGGFAFDVCRYSSYPSVNVTVTGNSVIKGDIEVFASGSDAKDGFSLMLESGTFTGKIVLDPSAEAAMEATPDKATVKKTNANVAEGAIGIPADYKWVDNGDGTSTLTPKHYVAQIGETKYESLAEAAAKAQNGDTIVMIDNSTETDTADFTAKNVTLDLNGKTVTRASGCIIGVEADASLTIIATNGGTIEVNGGYYNIGVDEGGSLTINEGTIKTKGEFGIVVNGTLIMNGGSLEAQTTSQSAAVYPYGENAEFIMNGGSIRADGPDDVGVMASNSSKVFIAGGSITASGTESAAVAIGTSPRDSAEVTITGGTISAEGDALNAAVHNYGNGTIRISGESTLIQAQGADSYALLANNGEILVSSGIIAGTIEKNNGTFVISGGWFVEEVPEAYCVEGVIPDKNAHDDAPDSRAQYTVKVGEYVARIGDVKYETLEAAFAAAKDGETIKLLKSCSGNGIKAPQGKFAEGLTVDFAGYTYTVDGSTVGSTGTETNGFQLLKDNKITFKNGAISSEKAKILIQNYSDLTLEGMTLSMNNANYTSAYTLSNNNGNVTVKGSTISANPAGGFAFDVCRYSSYPSVHVTVEDSAITGNIEIYASGNDPKDGSGLTLKGETTVNGALVINGDLSDPIEAQKILVVKDNSITLEAPQDYKWIDNGNDTVRLTPKHYVAENTNTGAKYETLEEAIAAAKDGETIKLLKSCSGNGIKAPQGKFAEGLTVDFAGYTYTVDGSTVGSTGTETNGFQLLKDNKITFKNGAISSEKAKILIQNYSDLTLEGMTLSMNNANYTSAYTLSNNNGNVTVKGSTISANPAGGFAFDVCRYSSYPSVHVTVEDSAITGNIEIYASGNDPKDGSGLTLKGETTVNGALVINGDLSDPIEAQKILVVKDNSITLEAPQDYKWIDNGNDTVRLTPKHYVAENTNTGAKYETLEEAIAAAKDGETIKLLKSCSGNGIKAPQGKFAEGLTVDFAGYTYTVDGTTVGSTGTETNGFQLLKDNKITFKNGAISSEKAKILIQNYSDLTLEGMTLSMNNANYTSAYTLSNNNGNVTVKGSTISANPAGGFAFDVCRYSSYPSVHVTVEDSAITGNIEIYASNRDAKDGSVLTLKGATTVSGALVMQSGLENLVEDQQILVVKDNSITLEAPADYKWIDNGNDTVRLTPKHYVAENTNTGAKYETLEEAIAAAKDGETIKLLKSCSGNGIKAPQGKFTEGLTVDFAGFTYTVDGSTVGSTGTETNGFQLLKDNKITFKNGTISSEKAKILIQNYSDLTLDGMTLELNNANYSSAYTLSNNNGNVVIKNSTITANPAGGFAFDVCRYSSYPSVHVTVENSTINGNIEVSASGNDPKNGSGLTLKGETTVKGALVINGDLSDPIEAQKILVVKDNSITLEAPQDYKWIDNGNDTVRLTPKHYVAENTNTGAKYETLEEAIAAAKDGETIKLLKSCSGNGIKAPQGKFTEGLTVDFAGFTYTVDGSTVGSTGTETNGFQLLKDNKITFKNGTISSEKAKILIQNYSDLTLEGMTLELNNANYTSAYTLSNNNGNVVIRNSTITANPAGGFAFDVCRYSSYPSVHVTVENSTINGNIEVSASGNDPKNGSGLTLKGETTVNGALVINGDLSDPIEAQKILVVKDNSITLEAPQDYKWIDNGNDTVRLTPKHYVAENTNTGAKYETLEEAIAAAKDGETIKLLKSCSGNGIVVPQGKFATGLTVDFAGYTYTVDGTTVGSTGTETNGFQLLKDNKITFKNGAISSEKAKILIQNYSDLTLEGMTLSMNNANYTSAYTLSNNNGNVTVKGSTISANPAGGFAFDVCRYSSYPSVHVTVEDSAITGNIEIYASGNDPKDGSVLTLKGATTVSGALVMQSGLENLVEDQQILVVKDNSITLEAPADYKWIDNGSDTVRLTPKHYVAENTNTGAKYETLAEAIAEATAGDTIRLLKDIEEERNIINKDLTLNLDGNTLTGRLTAEAGKVTVDNGTIVGRVDGYDSVDLTIAADAKIQGQLIVWGDGENGQDGCKTPTVTVNGTITNSGDAAISTNGTDKSGAKIIIGEGAKITSTDEIAIYLPSGNLTVNGGEITGTTAIYQKSGSLEINGGTITGNGDKAEYSFNGNGANATGDAIVVESCGYPNGTPTATVNGGTLVSAKGLQVGYYEKSTDAEFADVYAKDNTLTIPEDYKWVETETEGLYKLTKRHYVAQNVETQKKYETLTEAVNAAADNQTVKLLEDLTGELSEYVIINNDKTFTVDLDGHTADGGISLKRGHVTIDNGQITDVAYGYALEVTAFKQGEGTNSLTLGENVTVTGKYGLILWNASGSNEGYGSTITVNGKIEGVVFVIGNLHQGDSIINVNGSIESAGHGIALNGYAVVNVAEGASIVGGETGIEVRAGELNVTGGTVTGNGTPTATNPNGSGTTSVGAGIAVAQHTTKLPIKINITGGTIEGYSAFYESNPQNNGAEDLAKIQVSITGGNFVAINGGAKAIHADDLEGFVSAVMNGEEFSSRPWASSKIDAVYVADPYAPSNAMEHEPPFTVSLARTVTFDANGGVLTVSGEEKEKFEVVIADGEKVERPAEDPTREGYTFQGWFNGEDEFNFDTPITSDITLKAKWEINVYTVTFTWTLEGVAEPVVETVTVEHGQSLNDANITVPAPTDTNYDFLGFYTDAGNHKLDPDAPITGNMIFIGQWDNKTYLVVYTNNADSGKILESYLVKYGEDTPAFQGEMPEREGYAIRPGYEWRPAVSEKVTAPANYDVNWVKILNVTFVNDGVETKTTVLQGDKLAQPEQPVKEGYTFLGWYAENSTVAFDFNSEVQTDLVLTAIWQVNTYTITFDTAGGSAVEDVTLPYGAVVTAPEAPEKKGYTFIGWTPALPETMPAENLAVTAQWQINQYSLTFLDGETELAKITQDYGTAVTAPANPEKEGYTFTGWSIEVPATMPAEDLVIEAQWQIKQYTVSFDTDGGNEIETVIVDHGALVERPADPTKDGAVFGGWMLDGTAYDFTAPVTSNLTLKAAWVVAENVETGRLYATLTEAMAEAENGQTVRLLVDRSENLILEGGKQVTLDLNEKTLTGYIDAYDYDLTLTNGKLAGTVYANGLAEGKTGKLTVAADAVIEADYAIILYQASDNTGNGYTIDLNGTVNGIVWVMGNIKEGNSVINVNSGAKVSGDDVGIALNGYATVNVKEGAEVTGTGTGIEVRAGELNVTGGTITGDSSTATTVTANGSGTTTTGAGIAVAQHTTRLPITVNITGGTISGYTAFNESDPQDGDPSSMSISITGGNFVGVDEAIRAENATGFVSAVVEGESFTSQPWASNVIDAKYIAEGFLPDYDAHADAPLAAAQFTLKQGTVVAENVETGRLYATLAEAMAEAENGQTVRLLVDRSENLVLEGGKQVTLDLNEKTLTGYIDAYDYDLTLTNGKLAGTVYANGLAEGKTGKLTVAADAVIAADYAIILYQASDNTGNGYTIDLNGTVNGIVWVMGNIKEGNSVINVNSGAKISGDDVGIALNGYATVNVKEGAEVTGTATGIEVRAGELNVTGGTITGDSSTATTVTANGSGTTTTGAGIAVAQHTTRLPITVNITGGTISGYTAFNESDPQDGDPSSVSISITGGNFVGVDEAIRAENATGFVSAVVEGESFTSQPWASNVIDAKYIAEGFLPDYDAHADAPLASAQYTLKQGTVVAENVETGRLYATLTEAMAEAENGQTVRLLVDRSENLILEGGKHVTLDLNEKTLTGYIDAYDYDLTLTNGKLAGTVYANGLAEGKTGKLTVAADAVIAADYAIILYQASDNTGNGYTIDLNGTVNGIVWVMGNIKEGNSVINVNSGAKISGDDVGIALNGYATVNVKEGAEVTGTATGIEVRAGVLNVSGGTIQGDSATATAVKANGSGTTTSGAGIAVAQHTTRLPITVNITGGTISGYTAFNESDPQDGDPSSVSISITGGNFVGVDEAIRAENATGFVSAVVEGESFTSQPWASNVIDAKYIAEGFLPDYDAHADAPLASAQYTLKQGTVVAENVETGRLYATLTEAMAEAENGQTVRLLVDRSENLILEGGKHVTLDLNEKTLTGYIDAYDYDLTLTNGKLAGTVYANGLAEGKTGKLTVAADAVIAADYAIILYQASDNTGNGYTIDLNGTVNGIVWVMGNIKEGNSVINVNSGAKISGDDVGIALNGYATVNVKEGAEVTGTATGIEVRAGVLNVSGGTIQGDSATATAVKANGSGTTTSGAGIAVAQHTTRLPITVNITGGTISGYTAFNESDPQDGDPSSVSISITGGNFVGADEAIHAEDLTGFVSAVVDGEGTFTSQPWASSKIDATYVAEGFAPSDAMEHDPAYTVVIERTVTFDPDNGEENTTVSVGQGGKVEKPDPDPEKEGYTFMFWSADGENAFDFNTPITEDLTLTAIWDGKEYTVTVTSAGGSLDGPTVANLQGGGTLRFGESTTLVAPDVDGYTFAGWYRDGSLVSDAQTYVFTLQSASSDTIAFIALYQPQEAGLFRLQVTGSKFKVSNLSAVQRSYFDDWYTADTQVTVTFVGSNDETFLYWVNGNGKIVSTSPEYTFYMVYHTEIHAVYSDSDDSAAEALVVFLNSSSNPQVLASHYYTSNETIAFPKAPTKLGNQFVGWSMTEEEIKAAMASESKIIVVAKYEAKNKYTVTIRNNKNSNVTVTDPIPSGNQYTITADESLGTFSYWLWNDKIISYTPSMIIRFTDDVVLTAVYDQDNVEPEPVITMTGSSSSTVESGYGYTFVMTRSVPEGWTLQRQGILYTYRTDLEGKDLKSEIVLGGNQITDKSSNNLDLNGVFAFTVKAKAIRTYYARGFMIVMKDGVSQIIYSDEILMQTYEP